MNQTYTIELDTDKVVDDAIFLAMCGRTHCVEASLITGVVRLEMARDRLDKAIKGIHKMINERVKDANQNAKSN